MGTVICLRCMPSAIRVFFSTLPKFSWEDSLICLSPSANVSNLEGVSTSRSNIGPDKPVKETRNYPHWEITIIIASFIMTALVEQLVVEGLFYKWNSFYHSMFKPQQGIPQN